MLLRLLKPHGVRIVLLLLAAFVGALSGVMAPWIYSVIFRELLTGYSTSLLLYVCGLIACICALSIVVNMVTYSLLVFIRTDFARALRLEAMSGFLDYPYSFFHRHPASFLMGLVGEDMEKLAEFVYHLLRLFLSAVQLVLMFVVVLVAFDVKVFLLFLSAVLVYFGWSWLFKKLATRCHRLSLDVRDEVNQHCFEIFPGIKEIKCYRLYEKRAERFRDLDRRQRPLAAKIALAEALLSAGASLPVRLAMVGLLIFGYLGVTAGTTTPSHVMTTLIYAGILISPLVTLFDAFSYCYFSWHLRGRIAPLLELPRESDRGAIITALRQGVTVTGLHFSFPARRHAAGHAVGREENSVILQEVDLNIPAGNIAALVGSSGAGKTTFISLLVKLYTAPPGSIFFDGHDINGIQTRSLRRLIGVVTQEPYILNDTVRANIDPGGRLSDNALHDILDQVALERLARQLPDGLDTLLLERGQNLSGGEKQRVVLARLLARGCRVLILDEATSALDLATEADIIDTIHRLRREQGLTVIGISHRFAFARRADQIHVFEGGRVLEHGTHAELLAGGGRYHTLFQKAAAYPDSFGTDAAAPEGTG